MAQTLPQGPNATPNPPQKGGFPVWAVVIIAAFVLAIMGMGILAILAVYGTRKYIQNAKNAEAHNTLVAIAQAARSAYEESATERPGPAVKKRLCPSASQPVPVDPQLVSAKKYASSPTDWKTDESSNAGFFCLKFSIDTPQYYQYSYAATPTSFVATARGDLNGNSVLSTFSISGEVKDGVLAIAPNIIEGAPAE